MIYETIKFSIKEKKGNNNVGIWVQYSFKEYIDLEWGCEIVCFVPIWRSECERNNILFVVEFCLFIYFIFKFLNLNFMVAIWKSGKIWTSPLKPTLA
jgi:hypothetical protein